MGFASLVCTYLYGTFAVIKTALEGFTKLAKNLIKRLDTLATTLMTTVRYTINATMRTIINLVKQYEKELFDLQPLIRLTIITKHIKNFVNFF